MKILSLLAVASSLLFPVPSSAQSTARTYLVEAIVFKNLGADSSDGELWEVHAFELPQSAQSERRPVPTDPQVDVDFPVEYSELKELAPTLDIIQSDPRYQVLTYRAWIQPLTDREAAPAVPLDAPSLLSGTAVSPELFHAGKPLRGSIRVYENRLLFVEADLTARLTVTQMQPRAPLYEPVTDTQTSTRSPTAWNAAPHTFTIKEQRRVKLNEVHYFDHPFFGLLVRVTRLEESADSIPPR